VSRAPAAKCRAKDAKIAKESLNNIRNLNEEEIGKHVLDSAFRVHTSLGAGLLESIYESALTVELAKRGLSVERQKPIPVFYDGVELDSAFGADLIVEKKVLVELKSVETVTPLFKKIANYIRLLPVKLGYLINFNEAHLKNGITRITNGLEGKAFFSPRNPTINSRKPSLPSRSSRDL
jgi:GxxExxY protein